MDPKSKDSFSPVNLQQVTENYELVEKISKVPTRSDNPVQPIKMISVRVA
jgi:hypothetical protein